MSVLFYLLRLEIIFEACTGWLLWASIYYEIFNLFHCWYGIFLWFISFVTVFYFSFGASCGCNTWMLFFFSVCLVLRKNQEKFLLFGRLLYSTFFRVFNILSGERTINGCCRTITRIRNSCIRKFPKPWHYFEIWRVELL